MKYDYNSSHIGLDYDQTRRHNTSHLRISNNDSSNLPLKTRLSIVACNIVPSIRKPIFHQKN